jgi:hypothetical protein
MGLSRTRFGLAASVIMAAVLVGATSAAETETAVERGFRNPPQSAKPHTWWHWMNGNVTREGITADLEAMKKAGIGGAQMFTVSENIPAGPVGYMSPQWQQMVLHAIKEADRLGIELCLHNCAGWSSSGGPWIKPEHAMQVIAWSDRSVQGPARFAESLPQPKAPQVVKAVPYYRDIVVLAYPTPSGGDSPTPPAQILGKTAVVRQDGIKPDTSPLTTPSLAIPRDRIVDLTAKMDANGRLTWDVPAGKWTILRIGYTPTGKTNHPAPPEGEGLEVDKLSREALDAHWDGMMARIIREAGPLAGKVLNNALIDSYEVGSQNWTPGFREEFRKRRGYDVLPWLPVVTGRVIGSKEESERFLWDFRRTIADMFADNYFGYFGERCRKKGMLFSTEPYGNGTFDNLQCGGKADIPMGEFWVDGAAIETTKLASSVAHTYGRKFVGAESFTAGSGNGRWLVQPYGIKALGDLVFCNGINRYIFHRYAHQPWMDLKPGMTMGQWGTHLERTVTWWNEAATWLQYVARCQYLLQEGKFVADAVYFEGEDAPNDLPYRPLRDRVPTGHDYDGCDVTVLIDRLSVRDGRIVLPDGMSYRVLLLPDSPFMTPDVAHKVRELVRTGATVVGPKPRQSPSLVGYPACDEEVRRIADEVWGGVDGKSVKEHAFEKGRVIWGQSLQKVFSDLKTAPDFDFRGTAGGAKLAYIHRIIDGTDAYFVSNQQYRQAEVECTFRVHRRTPELWHADTGKVETAPVYREVDGRTVVPLRLDPAESVFVVFRNRAAADHLTAVALKAATRETTPSEPQVIVRKARYEAADGRGADVTARVAQIVLEGRYDIPADNETFGGDPVPNVGKRLSVEFDVDGKAQQKTVSENETLLLLDAGGTAAAFPAYEIAAGAGGATILTPWQAGTYEIAGADGKSRAVGVPQAATQLEVKGPWKLTFPAGLGAPPSIQLEQLVSWAEHGDPGVRYFSGTAEYATEFDVPAEMIGSGKATVIDLGRVKNFATVRLNGKELGVLWKAPFRVDVATAVKPGRNRLEVKVTNLWPNRLIGDEQLPPDVTWDGRHLKSWPEWLIQNKPRTSGRITFTTWHFYAKDSQLLESGLLGPVVVRSAEKVKLERP